jgi:hypothetical protein
MVSRFQGKEIFLAMCCLFLVMGVILVSLTITEHFGTKKILDDGIQTDCHITELTTRQPSKEEKLLLICEFFDTKNQSHQVRTQDYRGPSPYKIGEKVLVYYYQQDPANAKLNLYSELWGRRDAGIILVTITLFLSGLMAAFI